MTIRDLIDKINDEKPHSFPESKVVAFLNEIEPDVAEQLRVETVPVYSDDPSDMDTALLAPAPYDRLYVSYVKARIDKANEEYPSYQLNAEQHMQDFSDFSDWVVRTARAVVPGTSSHKWKGTW